ncbi:hypothetical protein [uncultured Mucilaginibacter sp.]|uniref:tetratricopeptide repeat protein n=1 Tax=uncultured Mucilaginibacter sp. TaxID=797541 RepID=UPI0025CEA8CA|nr:hypothetical protein [uncultured Mucilaginibacter sp.]
MKNTLTGLFLMVLMFGAFSLKAQQYNINDAVLIDMYQNQRFMDAVDYLKKNCPEPVTNIKILSRFAYAYQMAGKALQAETYYKRMYDQDSTSVPVLLSLAGINASRENKPQAIYYYEKASHFDKNNFQVYKQLGHLYLEKADTLNALKNLSKANYIDAEEPNVATDLSAVLIATKKLKQAESILIRALAADSTNLLLLRQVVNLQYNANRFKETIVTCNKIIEQGDQSVGVISKLGNSYYKLKNYECCIESFAMLPDIYQTEGTYYLVAMSYKALKKYKPALENFDNALKQAISPYTDSYYDEIADIDDTLNQFKTEAANYQKSLFFKESGTIYYSLGSLYDKQLHDKKNALKYFKKYLDSKPPEKEHEYVAYVQSRVAELKK